MIFWSKAAEVLAEYASQRTDIQVRRGTRTSGESLGLTLTIMNIYTVTVRLRLGRLDGEAACQPQR